MAGIWKKQIHEGAVFVTLTRYYRGDTVHCLVQHPYSRVQVKLRLDRLRHLKNVLHEDVFWSLHRASALSPRYVGKFVRFQLSITMPWNLLCEGIPERVVLERLKRIWRRPATAEELAFNPMLFGSKHDYPPLDDLIPEDPVDAVRLSMEINAPPWQGAIEDTHFLEYRPAQFGEGWVFGIKVRDQGPRASGPRYNAYQVSGPEGLRQHSHGHASTFREALENCITNIWLHTSPRSP